MEEPTAIVEACAKIFETRLLSGKSVVITAGPTREAIDPVRYISNHSSGKMGFALAQAASDAGALVTLISGPVYLKAPERVTRIDVNSAQEMYEASLNHGKGCDIFIACAAVADYRPETCSEQKIKKEHNNNELILKLIKNPDIVSAIAQLSPKPFVLGFAAESENLTEHAKLKLENKKLDMIAANDISNTHIGFNSEENAVTLFYKKNNGLIEKRMPQASKYLLARQLIETIAEQFKP